MLPIEHFVECPIEEYSWMTIARNAMCPSHAKRIARRH